jgi:hypothetical protein
MRQHLVHCVFAFGFVLSAANTRALAQETQSFTTIDVPGATGTVAQDVNDAGDVVGSYVAAGRTRGFLLDRNGQLYWIDFPGAVFTRAAGINARREIVGTYRLPTGGSRRLTCRPSSRSVLTMAESILGETPWGPTAAARHARERASILMASC